MNAPSHEFRDFLAKLAIVGWIAALMALAVWVAHLALITDGNSLLGVSGGQDLPKEVALEVRLVIGMAAVAIMGGTCFIIKDFYKSVKNANRYALAFADYRSGALPRESFQKLIPLDVYVGRFNHTWLFWFLVQPVLSTLLGVVAFFIARSGLGVLQGASASGELTAQSVYLYAVFTFLAGFSSHKFIAWLDRLADKIFSTTLPEQKAAIRADVNAAAANDRADLKADVASNPKDADGDGQDDDQPAPTALAEARADEATKAWLKAQGKKMAAAKSATAAPASRPDADAADVAAEMAAMAGSEGAKKVM